MGLTVLIEPGGLGLNILAEPGGLTVLIEPGGLGLNILAEPGGLGSPPDELGLCGIGTCAAVQAPLARSILGQVFSLD